MSSISIRELLQHIHIRTALVAVVVVAAASAGYYYFETRMPVLGTAVAARGDLTADVLGNGVVSPVENPELSFVAGGRVTQVNVQVGDRVQTGTLLASLDTGTLGASLAGAQAKLDELIAGAPATDVASAETSVSLAKQQLDNAYNAVPGQLFDAESKAEKVLYVDLAPLFGTQGAQGQQLSFALSNHDDAVRAGRAYDAAEQSLSEWKAADTNLDAAAPAALETALADDLSRLRTLRAFLTDFSQALASTHAAPSVTDAELQSYRASVSGASESVNTLIASLTAAQSSIANAKLGVASAENARAKITTGTRPEDIAGQRAAVAGAAAQLRLAQVVAPFSGTVASVGVKAGDVVAPNSFAVLLVPDGTFQVPVYVSEIDATKLAVGDAADVTLDAYGASRVFRASVGVIDRAPAPAGSGNAGGYKVTLVFDENDSAIAVGMHANAVIHAGAKQDVIVIPRSALIQEGSQLYVLKESAHGTEKAPVTAGLVGSDSVEIVSGLAEGDRVVRAGTR